MLNYKLEAPFPIEEVDPIYQEKKILVVDDNDLARQCIVQILRKNAEYRILTASNGKQACEIATAEVPDLIIMDWQMPVMDGIEAVKWLRLNGDTRDIPVIITSAAMISSHDLSTALHTGACDFISKPVNEIEFTARVTNMLGLCGAFKEIKQQKEQLQKQFSLQLINIQQLNELKEETHKHLFLLKDHFSDTGCDPAKGIINSAERLLCSNANLIKWDEMELQMELLFQGFFSRLRDLYGNLTPNELRLCTFIKLNIRNDEIARITFTSYGSVNAARKRLKKKLGLAPGESLQSFINNF